MSRTSTRPKRWLTPAEACEYLNVAPRTLRDYIARGDLPAVRIQGSRMVRVSQEDVDALLRPIPSAGEH